MPTWCFIRFALEVVKDDETCLKWCEDHGLILATKLCSEGHGMSVDKKGSNLGEFKCGKKHTSGKVETVPRSKGTWFGFNCKVPPRKVLALTYCFARGFDYETAIFECSFGEKGISRETVNEWYCYLYEVISSHLLQRTNDESKLGSKENIIDMKVLQAGRRKRDNGPISVGAWIFLLIETGSKRFRSEICDEDDPWSDEALFSLLKKHVAEGTIIKFDEDISIPFNDGYYLQYSSCLSDVPGKAVEELKSLQDGYRKYARKISEVDYLFCYLFRRECNYDKKDAFEEIVSIISKEYSLE